MAESDIQKDDVPFDGDEPRLRAARAGSRLRAARESAGLKLSDIAARTKIAERHLASIEESRYEALASRTYAVGFARAYARTVGLDEREIAQAVRDELAALDDVRQPQPVDVFEPGDPARVPGSRLAWVAALGGAAVIALVFFFWRSFFSPAVTLPDLAVKEAATPAPVLSTPAPAPAAGAPVVFTALEPDVWVKFYDAAGVQLMQKQMARGETYTVPADAEGPQIRTGRPDALQIAVGGRVLPRLAERPINIRDVPVSAEALLARSAPAPAPSPSPASLSPASRPVPQAVAPPAPQPAAATPAPASRAVPATAERREPEAAPAPASTQAPAAGGAAAPSEPETSTVSE